MGADAIQKAARVEKQALAGEELALINRQALKELTAEEVFVFRVAACDNQVDRDEERFTEAALARLQAEYDALKRPAASFSDVSGRFRASFGRKKTGCLFRHPVFSFRPRDYFFSVRVMRFSLMRAFLPVRSRR